MKMMDAAKLNWLPLTSFSSGLSMDTGTVVIDYYPE
jgi:hypothetical protein